ncbi:hypothetical protein SAMN05518801_10771 [Novosphingobium sp. CF614]|uniref:hypothetical protein n=1 Tax=Novosphingobium sp. CF614 TaxID=1884364 RepID=UPI0008E33D7D|nr:hypothetical protein [Novosphingobium sp. CF614]SFG09075.1 hypothetical protein SAMN05518801_10771 [Novosphingobium sp. CF614]
MTRFQQVERAARDAVIAARFHGGPPPANPWRKDTISHIRWNMAQRRAEKAAADLLRVGS